MRSKGENYKSPKAKSRASKATRRRIDLRFWAREKLRQKTGEASPRQSPTIERLKSIGRIRNFLQVWQEHTEEDEILDAVKGFGLSFVGDPVQGERRTRFANPKDQEILREEVLKNLKKGIIEEAQGHEDGEWISNVFLVPKKSKDGKPAFRMILDLKEFNHEYVEHVKFKMETLKTVTKLILPGCWFYSLDLADAYYSIPIHKDLRKYLRFEFEGKLYQYTCMPNGYRDAPRIFTRLLSVPLCKIRRELLATIAGYIDDTIGVEIGDKEALAHIPKEAAKRLEQFGFTINWEKSQLSLTQKIIFLGLEIDSVEMTIAIPFEKAKSIKKGILELIQKDEYTIRDVCRIAGKIVATGPANRFARLYTTRCLVEIQEALQQSGGYYDSVMKLSKEAIKDLKDQSERLIGCKCPIYESEPDLVVKTDASHLGWGAFAPFREDRFRAFGGRWGPEDLGKHINTLETIAAALGLKFALNDVSGKHVRLRSDNTTAVSVIKKQGDTKCEERNYWVQQLWRFMQYKNMWLSVTHIPGVLNVEADKESRYFQEAAEWGLRQHLVDEIERRWGLPQIDLFATNRNAIVERYASWGPDPEAEIIDCFQENWNKFDSVYCFPPTPLVGRVIQKLMLDRCRGILVLPFWPGASWYNRFRTIDTDWFEFEVSEETVYLSVDDWKQRSNCPWGHIFRVATVDCRGERKGFPVG
jgi:hypothetical protein